MPDDLFAEVCEAMGVNDSWEGIFHLIGHIQETDTCSGYESPVEVWIDEEGWYRILVYDEVG